MEKYKYNFFQEIINNSHLTIYENGYLVADSRWNFNNVSSPFSRLYFVTAGEGFIQNAIHKTTLLPGNAYIVPAHTEYNYFCKKHMEKFYIHFNIEVFFNDNFFKRN